MRFVSATPRAMTGIPDTKRGGPSQRKRPGCQFAGWVLALRLQTLHLGGVQTAASSDENAIFRRHVTETDLGKTDIRAHRAGSRRQAHGGEVWRVLRAGKGGSLGGSSMICTVQLISRVTAFS